MDRDYAISISGIDTILEYKYSNTSVVELIIAMFAFMIFTIYNIQAIDHTN